MSLPKIAIIGGGPGGLTLANILQKNEVPFVVFELDTSANVRNQGGSLDLHPQGGQAALREAGLWDQFVKHSRPESDVLKIVRQSGEVLWDGNGPDARVVAEEEKFDHRPEIDRAVLKDILASAVKPEYFKWGKKLTEVVESQPGKYDLHFADGTIGKDFDVVVGADGAWSKVRSLLTDIKPFYSGISAIELWALNVEEKHKWLSQYIGAGNCFSFGEGRTLQCQRVGDGSIRSYACLRKPETFLEDCGIDWTKPDTARKEYVERYYNDCGEDLKRVILDSSDQLVPRPLYMLPVGMRWESRAGITLLGDAGHLMTPFAGVGVNVAMADALELARAIIGVAKGGEGKSVATAIADYEKELFPCGEKFAQKTMHGLEKHFSAGGNDEMVKRLRAAFGPK